MSLIWATRGRHWGFRFVYGGGYADPLIEYDKVFKTAGPEDELFMPSGARAALRFPDPLGRTDRAGRVIPHEFVLDSAIACDVDEARAAVWPLIADYYATIWDVEKPPTPQ
ncbi:hypothetical protein [Dietzia maris]|uniref:hypothetical protein n=1 Tax=Dietzia maris TaxID=37915 RepID=UPI00223B9C03|nr:hypothetical protein [Dietzia maris]MCT1433879.1 hypothetical protein [Dietzia maris]MCT1520878.1 hypothetical protein [Dietzia maris]